MNPSIKSQAIDQGGKGLAASLITYLLVKYGMDTELIFIVMPVITLLLAFVSSKIGDPTIASFFSSTPVVEIEVDAAPGD